MIEKNIRTNNEFYICPVYNGWRGWSENKNKFSWWNVNGDARRINNFLESVQSTKMKFYNKDIDHSKYVIATYFIKSRNVDLKKASWDLAIGQIGNPNVRNQWETGRTLKKVVV